VYSATDRDVVPPTPIRREQFILQRFAARTDDDVVTFELLVNEQGRVESVTVTNVSETLGQTMLHTMAMHALRVWEFQPALKTGAPVKYRHRLSFHPNGQEVQTHP
jgi:TonB family protein